MQHWDLGVVGGSFAGLACAWGAAAHGASVAVFERKKRAGSHTQSTGIFVKEVAEQLSIPSKLTRQICGVRLYAPNMRSFDLFSPGYYFLATNTCEVLDWLASQVQLAGGTVCVGQKVEDIVALPDRVFLSKQNASLRYLVGADGAQSIVSQQCQLGVNKKFLRGAEYELQGFDNVDKDFLHVFLDSHCAPGYIGWLLHGVEHVQVGVAGNGAVRARLNLFLKKLHNQFGGHYEIVGGRGGLIPCGGIVRPYARDRVCLLGDAAGMVSPLTAGGIHPSIQIGKELGKAVSRYLYSGGPLPQDAVRAMIPSYALKKHMRTTFDYLLPPNHILNFALGSRVFKHIAQIIFFHNRGLFSSEAWREIVFGLERN